MADNAPVSDLVSLLDVEQLDVDLYRGREADTERPRVYGGQVAAQALIAGVRTVDPAYVTHSLHSYFLLPGDTSVPIIYDVERIRDGRSFATRRVVARQHGRPIYYLTASFQRAEDGFEHQDVMPADVPPPEQGLDLVDLMRKAGNKDSDQLAKEWGALEARHLGTSLRGLPADDSRPARARMWIRINGRLSDDPVEHLAAFTYASDMSLLGATLSAHETNPSSVQMASLDHTIWFHRPFRADEWWLYDQASPSASNSRGLALARVFTQDGLLVATVAQEGLIRQRS
ncbi:acyl-CoA thioesterase II [Nocardioides sp. KIGAM211]|uniref:Acyl-CoA thioesterase 2 n=1 Tax=Nocardioides luti TaxID=2761101 RepID=A0A7X0RF41_9ACTN|nr:acyl-CoA thioesterase II [Nocardioides luti]